jgi:hypothetical protein
LRAHCSEDDSDQNNAENEFHAGARRRGNKSALSTERKRCHGRLPGGFRLT